MGRRAAKVTGSRRLTQLASDRGLEAAEGFRLKIIGGGVFEETPAQPLGRWTAVSRGPLLDQGRAGEIGKRSDFVLHRRRAGGRGRVAGPRMVRPGLFAGTIHLFSPRLAEQPTSTVVTDIGCSPRYGPASVLRYDLSPRAESRMTSA